jgi:histone-lysine N-methyltransferase SUV420H
MLKNATVCKFNGGLPAHPLPTRDDLKRIIHQITVDETDITEALCVFLNTSAIQKYTRAIGSERRILFIKQSQRYLSIYLPQCKFALVPTTQYDRNRPQVAVAARKYIACGETIQYLDGMSAEIGEREVAWLVDQGRAVSIVESRRFAASFVLLCIARLVNHDCNPSARLVNNYRRSKDGVLYSSVVATRDIVPGEEITIYYAEGYFGQGNVDCLCKTCKDGTSNGWRQPLSSPSSTSEAGDPLSVVTPSTETSLDAITTAKDKFSSKLPQMPLTHRHYPKHVRQGRPLYLPPWN